MEDNVYRRGSDKPTFREPHDGEGETRPPQPAQDETLFDHPAKGLPVREAGTWTGFKLEILRQYLERFARACSKAPTIHFVDAFSGPGRNLIDGNEVDGSPLLALKTKPEFDRCLLMDLNPANVEALRTRTAAFGERVRVIQGNCNIDLVPKIRDTIGPWDPTLVLLDPEGTELEWATVEQIASIPRRRRKVEMLILLATHTGFSRLLDKDGPPKPHVVEKMNLLYGNERWREIHRQRVRGDITTDEATTRYVKLYAEGLERFGYRTLDREIRDRGHDGRLRYFLIFASEHHAGIQIMDYIFDNVVPKPEPDPQGTLFDLPPVKPKRRRRLA